MNLTREEQRQEMLNLYKQAEDIEVILKQKAQAYIIEHCEFRPQTDKKVPAQVVEVTAMTPNEDGEINSIMGTVHGVYVDVKRPMAHDIVVMVMTESGQGVNFSTEDHNITLVKRMGSKGRQMRTRSAQDNQARKNAKEQLPNKTEAKRIKMGTNVKGVK